MDDVSWHTAAELDTLPEPSDQISPLFQRLDLDEILEREKEIAGEDSVRRDEEQDAEVENVEDESIEFETFAKVEMIVGKVKTVDIHPKADRLYVVSIDDGSEQGRTVCAGLRDHYDVSELVGRNVVVVANLAPRKLRGIESEGMLLAADGDEGTVSLLTLDKDVPPGSRVR